MDHKKSPLRRPKRQAKSIESIYWSCSLCTYQNSAEAFKCLMCDVRKGTSTRKPRLNSALVAQQNATQSFPGNSSGTPSNKVKLPRKNKRKYYKLKNIDRSTGQSREITVNSVTITITEYKPKAISADFKPKSQRDSSESFSESNDSIKI